MEGCLLQPQAWTGRVWAVDVGLDADVWCQTLQAALRSMQLAPVHTQKKPAGKRL